MENCMNLLRAALKNRTAVKVIAGIANMDLENVLMVARAAEKAGAHAVDVAAQADIVKAVREAAPSVTVFASAVTPEALAEAVNAGAHVAELGNFDALYEEGVFLGAEEVLSLAEKTVALLDGRAMLSVTVPGHLTPESQVMLAKRLETAGVDIIQTEAATRVLSDVPTAKSLSPAEKEALTLRNTRLLVEATRLPVMTASGITPENAPQAILAGASAVGVGTYVREAQSETGMIERIAAVVNAAAQPVCIAQAS